jgi:hypothetical protein
VALTGWLQSRRIRSKRLALLLTVAMLHSACVISSALDAAKDLPSGEAQFVDAHGAPVAFAPTSCVSGEHQVFLGVDFLDAAGNTARLFVDPLGNASLRFFAAATPLNPGLVFHRDECESFQLSLKRTGWQINEIYDLSASLKFSCRSASGASATGDLRSGHCH